MTPAAGTRGGEGGAMADEALTGDLTDADRDYARRWAAARGVRPWPRDWMGDDGWRWLRFGA